MGKEKKEKERTRLKFKKEEIYKPVNEKLKNEKIKEKKGIYYKKGMY